MYLELLWFLLPVAAASGWWMAWRKYASDGGPTRPTYPPDYFKGLNYLLNEQQDKALEVFVRMVEVDSDTVETHLALGNLFRRRGEVDRAIRIHQNLIARPSLSQQQRNEALMELARDYMRAGLFDRAEGLFKDLLGAEMFEEAALHFLLEIYEREQEWQNAIDTAKRLQKNADNPELNLVMAHYYCQLAEEELEKKNNKKVKSCVRQALDIDPNSSRALILEAELAITEKKPSLAVGAYRRVQDVDAELLPEVIRPLLECLSQARDLTLLDDYINDLRQQSNVYTVVQAVTQVLKNTAGEQAANDFFKQQLLKRPSLRSLREWVSGEHQRAEGQTRSSVGVVLDLLTKLVESKPMYKCKRCGFTGNSLHWQCPSCNHWDTVKPITGIEGD